MIAESPYPELKKTHTIARAGRPWTDHKPPPAAPVWAVIEGFGRYHALVAALELDVFDTLAVVGPAPVSTVAAELDLSEPHLESLLDSVVAMGLLERVRGRYDLNDTARRYLTTDGAASMAALVAVAPGPLENWSRLAETVRKGRPEVPIDDDPAPFYRPLVEGTFTTMWRCATRADLQVRYSDLAAPCVLDLGAGGAPWAIAVLEACPDATAVINDLDGVIAVARHHTTEFGVVDRCEFRPGDFHAVALEDDHYDLAVLSHVCRTEGVDGTAHLIERAYRALRPDGRVLLTDYFVDAWRSNPHAVLMGTTVMTSTIAGFPITSELVADALRNTGFEAIRLVEPIGFQFTYVATKPRSTR